MWVAVLLPLAVGQSVSASEKPEFIGRSYDLRYDNGFHVIDSFVDDKNLRFKVLSAPMPGRKGIVRYYWQRVAPHIYTMYWTEADGGVVVHVDDFRKRLSRSYYTPPGRSVVPSMAKIPRLSDAATGAVSTANKRRETR